MIQRYVAGAAALLLAGPAVAADIFLAGGRVELNPTVRGRHDLVVQTLLIARRPGEVFALDNLTLELSREGRLVLIKSVGADRVAADTRIVAGLPVPSLVEAQALDPKGWAGLAGRPVTLAGSEAAAGEAQVTIAHHFSVEDPVDQLEVVARGRDAAGAPVAFTARFPVRQRKSAIDYRLPLDGVWLMNGVPSVYSHHRMTPPTEYAVDFFRLDGEGRIYAGGDGSKAENAYAFGAPVLAAADGVVVQAWGDEVQDRAARRPLPGEDRKAAQARIQAASLAALAKDVARAAAGNLVVIRHGEGENAEYSAYGHLMTGSVRVRPGQKVKQGEVIAQVGDTGDVPVPHLHFQVNAGPDPFRSRSLPVSFADAAAISGNDDLGRYVRKAAPPAG